jgi:hypothetical protein
MDDKDNKGNKRNGLVRGIIYTGIAGIIGAGGYIIGKYRHLGGKASYTLAGLALLIYAPRGFEVIQTALETHRDIAKAKIYGSVRKDSIDAIIDLKKPRDTSTLYIKEFFNKASETTNAIEATYKQALLDNSKKYETLIEQSSAQYTNTFNALRKQNENLQKTIEEFKNVQNNIVSSDDSPKRSIRQKRIANLEKFTTTNNNIETSVISESLLPAYYMIDADKSDGEIQVYGMSSDGSKKFLSITSKASFASNGGPTDGSYILRNKGARSGELYPGFLEMDDPVGISGAGEYNQYIEQIQQGALANKTGIRVPNEIYDKIARLVDEKKTIINVHE